MTKLKASISPGQEEEEKKIKFLQKNNDIYKTRIVTSNSKAIYNVFMN